jgi:hypothetical protein
LRSANRLQSMTEIHREVVFDLFADASSRQPLKVREHMIDGPVRGELTS